MPDGQNVVTRVTAWLPGGVRQRVRLLFAVFATLVAPLAALRLLSTDVPLVPNGLVVFAALAIAGGWAWAQFRHDGLPVWADPVPVLALFVAGWIGDPESVFGLLFVLLFGRMLYGTGMRVWGNALGYFLAFHAAFGLSHGLARAIDIGMFTTGLAVLLSAAVMRMIGEALRSQEAMTGREELLRATAWRLQRATDHEEVFQIVGEAGLALVTGCPDAAFTAWRGDGHSIRMHHGGGAVAQDTPVEVPMAQLPDDLRHRMFAGEPFHLDHASSASAQQAVGMEVTYTAMLLAPLTHAGRFAGTLFIGSRTGLDRDLVTAIGRLARDGGLALARADSALLLQRVVENSSDAIVLLDSSLHVDFASTAAGSLFGRAPGDLVGQSIEDLLHTEGGDIRQVLGHAAGSGSGGCPMAMAQCADGTVRQVELAATQMSGSGVDGWVVNARDVTRRAAFEEALRASEHQFRSLAEHVSEGMYQMTLGPEPRFEYVNPAMEEMCGFPAQAFLDDADLTLRQIHPDDRGLIECMRTSPEKLEWPVETRWRNPDGEWVWHSLRETAIRDADGVVVGCIGIVSDVTARKQQQEALEAVLGRERDAGERLRRVDAMRTTFIQAVSHELRTPLTAITGYTQTLRRSGDLLDPSTHATLLERLEVNAHKLDRLLADLLDVDRLSSLTIEPIRRQVDVLELVHRVVEQIDGSTHPVRCTGGPVTAHLDAPKVERIVENLVRNAMKHTPLGTTITVTVAPDESGHGAVLVVADEGPGVPDELIDSVFAPFVQGADSEHLANPGMGIGLSLVARFAELHGGGARVENRPGGGAAFRVWLPSSASLDDDHPRRTGLLSLISPHVLDVLDVPDMPDMPAMDESQGTSSRTTKSAS